MGQGIDSGIGRAADEGLLLQLTAGELPLQVIQEGFTGELPRGSHIVGRFRRGMRSKVPQLEVFEDLLDNGWLIDE